MKLLSENFTNNIYKEKINGKNYYIKRYPLINSKPDYRSSLWKELFILNIIKKLGKDNIFFTSLYKKEIIKCNLKFYNIHNIDKGKQTYKKCYDLYLEDKGEILKQNIKSLNTFKKRYLMTIQIMYALNILRKNKIVHRDVHIENITFTETSDEIYIGSKKLDSKYQYSIIDYGVSLHKKFNDKEYDNNYYINYDVILFLKNIVLQFGIVIDNIKEFKEYPIKMGNLVNIQKKYKSDWKKIKKLLLKKGKKYEWWYKHFEKGNLDFFTEDAYTFKSKGNHKINLSIINEIDILFSAYNRKGWLKEIGCKKFIGNLLKQKDIEFMILNLKSNKKIIDYFLKFQNT